MNSIKAEAATDPSTTINLKSPLGLNAEIMLTEKRAPVARTDRPILFKEILPPLIPVAKGNSKTTPEHASGRTNSPQTISKLLEGVLTMESKPVRNDPKVGHEFFERKLTFTMGPIEVQYKQKQREKLTVVDVRLAKDFEKAHIPGAVNLPEEQWVSLKGLNKDGTNVLYCYSVVCHLAARAAVFFAPRGYSVVEMDGGWENWQHYKREEEAGKSRRLETSDLLGHGAALIFRLQFTSAH